MTTETAITTDVGSEVDAEMLIRAQSLPPLSDLLPLRFANNAEIGGLCYSCAQCHDEIGPESIRGNVTQMNPHAYDLEAYGLCYRCRLISPLHARLADDGTMLVKKEAGWAQSRWSKESTPGIISRIKSIFGV